MSKTYTYAEGYAAAMQDMRKILDKLADEYAMLEEHLEHLQEISNYPNRSVEVTA